MSLCSQCKTRSGFTLLELLATIGVIALLAAVLVPASYRVLHNAKLSKNLANLKNIGNAVSQYSADNNNEFPLLGINGGFVSPFWSETLLSGGYLSKGAGQWRDNSLVFSRSPSLVDSFISNPNHCYISDFGANIAVFSKNAAVKATQIHKPSQLVMVMSASPSPSQNIRGNWYIETYSYVNNQQSSLPSPNDHGVGPICSLFVDGHVEAIPLDIFQERRRELLLNEQ